jgi:hypothetical protein
MKLPKKPKTNRDIILSTNLYDVLLRAHKTLAQRNTTCVLEALDESLVCCGKSDTCKDCIQRWLNQEVR